MCIAIYKPYGIKVPNLEQVTNCFDSNPDGAGVAYPCVGGKVQIIKGMQSAKEVNDFLCSQDFTNVPMLIHFRIGTHGDKASPKHTHPFPVGKEKEEMEELSFTADSALIHNGIMMEFGYQKDISDTMAFARDALPNLLEIRKKSVAAFDHILEGFLGWNKIAVLFPDGEVVIAGDWIQHDGIYWSNRGFEASMYALCDPRTWKAKSSTTPSLSEFAYGDEDEEVYPKATKPGRSRLWSSLDLESNSMIDFDALMDDYDKALKWIPANSVKFPKGATAKEWDTFVCYHYVFGYITDQEYGEFLKDPSGFTLPKHEVKDVNA